MNPQCAHSCRRRGFALVITVILLALLMLVLVSTATLTNIEASIGANSRREASAQQNALFALNRAIGELQRHAGPDRRITTRAEILASSTQSPHWTGVWDSSGGDERTWLVSGNEDEEPGVFAFDPSQAETLPGSALEFGSINGSLAAMLVGAGSTGTSSGNYVVAPLVDLNAAAPDGTPGTRVGRYAWWIADEGVKFTFNDRELHNDVNHVDSPDTYFGGAGTAGESNRKRLAQLALPRQRMDGILPNAIATPDTATNASLIKVLDRQQVPFATFNRPLGGTASLGLTALRTRFHELTVWSRGVLSDPTTGELKRDLTFPSGIDPSLAGYLGRRPSATSSDGMAAQYSVGGAPSTGWIVPVVTEATVWMRLSYPGATGYMPVTWTWRVELWNPYNAELSMSSLRLEVENVGLLSLYNDLGSKLADISWSRTLSDNNDTDSTRIRCFMVSPAPSGSDAIWRQSVENLVLAPGEVREVSKSSADSPATTWGARTLTGTMPNFGGGNYRVHFDLAQKPIFVLRDAAGNEVARYSGTPVGSTNFVSELIDTAGQSCDVFLRFRLKDVDDASDWLQRYDPRASRVEHLAESGGPETRPFDPLVYSGGAPPLAAGSSNPQFLTTGDFLLGTSSGSTRVVAFDIPRQQQVSIGALQHVAFAPLGATQNAPSFRVGNVWAGSIANPWGSGTIDANELFDRAFFSTIPRTWDGGTAIAMGPFANTRMEVYHSNPAAPVTQDTLADLSSHSNDRLPASRLLVKGAFNVNSVSVAAWASLLTGTRIEAWQHRDGAATTDTATVNNVFFRLPHTAQHIGQDYLPNPNTAASWRQGLRDLDDDQITELANEIVFRIMARNEPFRSVAEFVNSGILEDAIDAVGPSSPGGSWDAATAINAGIDVLSPAYLTQADLLNAWAPFLQVRSDTFVIRAYGETLNPVSGATQARAWCEAVVQRIPDYVNTADAPEELPSTLTPTSSRLGRRFEVLQFRWLSPADI